MPVSEMATRSQLQFLAMRFEEGLQIRAADLLLAFQQEDQVHGQFPVRGQGFFNAAQMRHVLALVVSGAAREENAVLHRGLERLRHPVLVRIALLTGFSSGLSRAAHRSGRRS